jgi:murein DD-endopeptidase MepM/ murein hydrolase activator NlpD
MIDFADTTADTTIDRFDACASCGASLIGRRYLQTDAAAVVRSYCSEVCLRAAQAAERRRLWKARRRAMKVLIIGLAVAGACLVPHQGPPVPRPPAVASAPPAPASAARVRPAGWFGPEWPPTETDVLAALGRDAWIHPLAGPVRRMPRTDSRVFGAVRAGNRAVECRNGHCGVDLGGEIWGEYVRAVHDGVVDFVQRGPNPDHGGSFVRINHRGGTVITMYFHLAAIPRRLERGTFVKSGDVVGLVGDTGVKDSPPHLHFSISIRPWPDKPEKYIDPEPLIALWPLRVPIDGGDAGLVTTVSEPGVPLGSMPWIAGRKRKAAAMRRGAAAAAPGAGGAKESGPAPSSGDEAAPESAPPDAPGDE